MSSLKDYYKDCTTARRPKGYILRDDVEIAQTMQCCHCGAHFIYRKGSGTVRGFCRRCMDITCGAPACNPCRPFEEQLRELDRG